ncbi:MAG: 2-amino-4-hydroxy-6-hydroxymethyldihydropteridine diphosphokinase [Thermoguttaceae bacterium]|jgi:2-amino-4-hydroxy-6-hydroxymethyldihydropteridine diphosphokinase
MPREIKDGQKESQALVAFGSNLGDPKKNIARALVLLAEIPGVRVVKTSSLYETYPVGCSHDSLSFINGVVLLRTTLLPLELLHELQWIERALRRVRLEFWGPRTLDLDLILYDDLIMRTPELTLPHPRLQWRDFVLAPSCEIVPEMTPPTLGLSFQSLKTLLDWNFATFPVVTALIYRGARSSAKNQMVASEGRKS